MNKHQTGAAFGTLLSLCALHRGVYSAEKSAAILDTLGPEPLDERLAASALQHKVAGLVWDVVRRYNLPLSPECEGLLKKGVQQTTLIRQMLLDLWPSVVQAVSGEGIRVLTIKGPAASLQWYGDPHVREYRELPQSPAIRQRRYRYSGAPLTLRPLRGRRQSRRPSDP